MGDVVRTSYGADWDRLAREDPHTYWLIVDWAHVEALEEQAAAPRRRESFIAAMFLVALLGIVLTGVFVGVCDVTAIARRSPNPLGRRGLYTPAKGKKAARMLAAGVKQATVAAELGVATDTLRSWLRRPELREMVHNEGEARALALELLAAETAEDLMTGKGGDPKRAGEGLKHARWLIGKLDRQRYGEHRDRAVQGVQVVINTDLWSPEAGKVEVQTFHVEAPIDAEFDHVEE